MVRNSKALGFGNRMLELLDLCVIELFHDATVQAYQMVMVLALIEFVNRFATFKMAAAQNGGLFKLGQHPVHRGKAHVRSLFQQMAKDVLGGHVPLRSALKYFEDFQPRNGGFEAGVFEFVGIAHVYFPATGAGRENTPSRYNPPIISFVSLPMFDSPRFRFAHALIGLACLGLAACSSFSAQTGIVSMLSPYKIDKVQGNVVTREQVAAIKVGMPKTAVKDILGTPLLTSVFHADRWDYVFTLQRQGIAPQMRRVAVFFNGDSLSRIEADELPSEAEFVATLKSVAKISDLPPMEASDASLKNFPVPKPVALEVPPVAAADSYPPLEPARK